MGTACAQGLVPACPVHLIQGKRCFLWVSCPSAAMTHAAGFLSQPLLHLLASPSHFHPSLAGNGVKYPVYQSPAPQGLQCLSWTGTSLLHTTHPTGMGDWAGHGVHLATALQLLSERILGTLSPRTCFQKLAFWEVLKLRVFLGHLLRKTPLPQPCTCRCPTAVGWGEN